MIFDQEHMAHQEALDQAFAEGSEYGRRQLDEQWLAECVELRVQLKKHQAAHYREGVWVGSLLTVLGVAVIVAAGFFVAWIA